MIFERVFRLEYVLFKFHLRFGVTLFHNNFQRELSEVSYFWNRCQYIEDKTVGDTRFPNNPWIHSYKVLHFKLPEKLSLFQLLLCNITIDGDKIRLYCHFQGN